MDRQAAHVNSSSRDKNSVEKYLSKTHATQLRNVEDSCWLPFQVVDSAELKIKALSALARLEDNNEAVKHTLRCLDSKISNMRRKNGKK